MTFATITQEQLAEVIARQLHPGEWWDKDPHPADREMWMERGRKMALKLRPILGQVYDDGYTDAMARRPGPNPYFDFEESNNDEEA